MEVLLARRPRHSALNQVLLGTLLIAVVAVRSDVAQQPTADAPVPHFDCAATRQRTSGQWTSQPTRMR